MPIYEYRCGECEQIFEEWQKDYEIRDADCPVCGACAQRVISNTSFVLKGGGWYADGYAGSCKTAGTATDSTGSSGTNGDSAKPSGGDTSSSSSSSTSSSTSSTATAGAAK